MAALAGLDAGELAAFSEEVLDFSEGALDFYFLLSAVIMSVVKSALSFEYNTTGT